MIVRSADRVATAFSAVAAILAIIMALFVVLSSVMRYLIGSPFSFTEELVGLLFTAMVFLGFPAVTFRQSHICVTIFPDMLSAKRRPVVDRLANALLVAFCVWFGFLTLDYMNIAISLETRSAGSRILLWPWTAVLPISCLVAGIAGLIRIFVPAAPQTSQDGAMHPGAN